MAFIDLYRELQGTFPDLPEPQCQRFINRAQRDAFDAWNWSFLAGEGSLNIPDSLNTGTLTVVQGDRTIVLDVDAAAAWLALDTNFIPIEQRAVKIGTDFPYRILAFDGVDTIYVDRPYTGTSASGVEYVLYKPYYAPPSNDFQRFISVVDTTDAWNLIPGKKKEWLDWIDPQRSTSGPAQFISFFLRQRAQTIPAFGALSAPVTLTATDLFELWPGPTNALSLTCYFKKRGLDLVEDTDESPFDDGLLISRALYHAYRFVQVNVANFSQLKGQRVAWAELKADANSDFLYELGNAIKRDDNINLASIIPSNRPWFPSSSWLQRHLTWGEYSMAYANSYAF